MFIMHKQLRKLHLKEMVTVKVSWKNHSNEEETWEDEKVIQAKYPHLFRSTIIHTQTHTQGETDRQTHR